MAHIRSLGHACHTITGGNVTLVTDPFLRDNPDAVCGPDDIAADYILLSHGHQDHLGDAIDISTSQNAPIIAVFELCTYCARYGAHTEPMHIGGARRFPFGRLKLTPALHGSAIIHDEFIEYTGMPCGFLITIADKNIYFAGDTGLFGDMELIGRSVRIDLAILPIGDNYTMGIDDAVIALQMLQPRVVVPMHYHLLDEIRTDPHIFAERVAQTDATCRVLDPGETIQL